MDSEKLKYISEDSETMLNTLKDFNKYNKKYNIFCYGQLLVDADFFKKFNIKDRFKDILPFVISLKPIIDYCNKYVENAGFLSFDEIENIIKEHQGKKESKGNKTNNTKGNSTNGCSKRSENNKRRSDVPEDLEPFELGEEEDEEEETKKEKPIIKITKRNIIKTYDIKEFKEIEDDKILIYLPELVELLKKEGFKTTEKDEEEYIKQNIKEKSTNGCLNESETTITPNRIMTMKNNEKNNNIIFDLYITRKYFEKYGYNVIVK